MPLPSAVQKMQDQAEAWAAQNQNPNAPEPPAAAPAATPVPDQPTASKQDDDWEKRFKGYKATTDQTIAELRQQVEAGQTTIANLNAKLTAAPAAPAQSKEDQDKAAYDAWLESVLPNPADRETYEDSFLRFQFRQYQMSQKAAKPAPVDTGLKTEVESLKQSAAKTERELFNERMDRAYPNDGWIIDKDEPGWGDFLNGQAGPYDRRLRVNVLETALAANDSETVITLVAEFKATKQPANPPPGYDPQSDDPRLTHLTPDDAAGSGAIDPNNQAPRYTQSQVQEIYANKTKGMYTPEEYAVLEKQIEAAGTAGNIVPG